MCVNDGDMCQGKPPEAGYKGTLSPLAFLEEKLHKNKKAIFEILTSWTIKLTNMCYFKKLAQWEFVARIIKTKEVYKQKLRVSKK